MKLKKYFKYLFCINVCLKCSLKREDKGRGIKCGILSEKVNTATIYITMPQYDHIECVEKKYRIIGAIGSISERLQSSR